MTPGNATEVLRAKITQVQQLGQTHGVSFKDVVADSFPDMTIGHFKELQNDEEKGHPKVNAFLQRWLQMIKKSQAEAEKTPAKVLPSQKDLAPSLPIANPLKTDELRVQLEQLQRE